MGWTVLYIAFGIVALWLLGEVLLQYKARLRWRILAFVGFLGVVLGVLMANVVVIGLGAAAFAVGQTYVTLSFRSGFADGWSVKGRLERHREEIHREPTLEVSDLEAADPGREPGGDPYGPGTGGYGNEAAFAPANAAETTAVYEPQPLPDDTDPYGVYSGTNTAGASGVPYSGAGQSADQGGYAYDGYSGYGQQTPQGYGYDAGTQQQYPGYADPYATGQVHDGTGYDTGYGQQPYGQDQYGGYADPSSGGVWVPQQRGADDPYGGELPPEQAPPQPPYPPYQGHNGYDEQQYRY